MASDGITSGKKYYFVQDGRGVGPEGDWVRLSKQDNDNWVPVVFHTYDNSDEYMIEHTGPDATGPVYWAWDSKGVRLTNYDNATLWNTIPTENGIMVYGYQNQRLIHAPKSSKRWLETETWPEVTHPMMRSAYILHENREKAARFEFKLIPV